MTVLTKLSKIDFNNILENYKIENYKSSKHVSWALANTIYIIKTSKGKFILKVFERADPNFIEYQIRLMEIANKNNLPVPKLILTNSQKELLRYHHKWIVIQEFVNGHHPEKLSNKLIINVAHNQALLNKALLKVKLENKYNWGGDYHFGLMAFKVKRFDKFNIRKEEEKILAELHKINKTHLRRSSIHGDFHSVNLLVQKNKLKAILDWDDAHEDYLIHDLVCFIAHSFVKVKNIYYKQIKLYLKEYQKILKLNSEEKKAVYYFIKQRYLAAISWQVKQIKNHKDAKGGIEKHIRKEIQKYNNFAKLGPKDFLKLY